MDVVVQKLVALGVPGLVLVFVIGSVGGAGAAAMTAALATLGGPMGMMGGIAVLGLIALTSDAIARFGLDAVAVAVVKGLRRNGTTRVEIIHDVERAPITRGLKDRILAALDQADAG